MTRPCQNRSPHRKRAALEALVLCSAFALCLVLSLGAASGVYGGQLGVANDEPPKRVFVLYDQNKDFAGLALVDRTLTETLKARAKGRLEAYTEFMDASRFGDGNEKDYEATLRQFYRRKYAGKKMDLLVAVFGPSLDFLLKYGRELFPLAPIVFCGIDRRELEKRDLGPNVTGVLMKREFKPTLDLALKLHADTRQVYFIAGTSGFNRYWLEQARRELRESEARVKITYLTDLPMEKLETEIGRLPPQSIILYLHLFTDGAGKSFNPYEALSLIARKANAPMYTFLDSYVGFGVVGGFVYSVEAHGIKAAELGLRILNGEKPANIPVTEVRTNVSMFDWRQLQRWGISEARLPPGSLVQFRQPTFWEHYGRYIVGALMIIALQTLLIVILLAQRARRRRAEAELRESQEFMDLALQAGELGLWARDRSGNEVWANAPLRSLFGFGENDKIGLNDMLARIHPDDHPRVVSQVQKAQAEDLPFEGEFRILQPQGRERWVLAKGRTVNQPSGRGARRMGVVMDITERKRAEETLRESEARFRTMADTAPVMIWMSDADKLCIFFNNGWLNFTGRTLEQELGNGWAESIHREDYDHCLGVYLSAFDARQDFSMEYRLRRCDGEYRLVLDNGAPRFGPDGTLLGYVGSCIDITERKQAEETLEQERAYLRQVIDIDPNFIFAKDRDGRFTLANQAVADAYGTTVEELIGKTDADFDPNNDEVEFFREMDLEVMDTLQERFIPEEHITDAHGKVRWLQTVKRPIVGKDGSANQILGVSTDITKRKEIDSEMRAQRESLTHMARIATMGELSASLAHELNQPLTAILSNAQAAQRFLVAKPADLEEIKDILKDIVEDNSRASEVIRRMRALVKKETLALVALDLAGVVREVMQLVHSDAMLRNVRISFESTSDSELPFVRGDKVQLQQVALNLLLNAFDAMKDTPAAKREVVVRAETNGSGVVEVSVRDHGAGLTSDNLDKIFQPFFTTKREGLGMGLSISRSIVEAHGGRLWAENNPDSGATFYFTVPVVGKGAGEGMME